MDKAITETSRFRNTVVTINLFITLLAGCGTAPLFEEGPLCDKAVTGDWKKASSFPQLDSVEFARWTRDPELVEELLTYGLVPADENMQGNDIDEEGIVVSPYGKTLNAYELIAKTEGLEGWGEYLRDHSHPVVLSCGEKAPGIVAYTYFRYEETHLYRPFFGRSVVSRAGFIIHEAGHAAGLPNHVSNGNKDRSFESHGPYGLQLEFLAAVFYAPGISLDHRRAAKREFEWMLCDKFVQETGMTLEDFNPTPELEDDHEWTFEDCSAG